MSFINTLRMNSLHWHRFFAWAGAAILFIYILSGISHPLMSWTGPKAVTFFPPTAKIKAEHLRAIPHIFDKHKIATAKIIKIIPSEQEPLLQVTEDKKSVRRYFDLNSYEEKKDYDKQHAIWLAKYYLGDKHAIIRTAEKQDNFNTNYPWVNRLLPVYKVTISDSQNTTLYIYTELNALAGISNDWKKSLQAIFQVLHTWSFLDNIDNARVIILALMMLTLIAFILTGIGLVFTFSSRKIPQASRRWHRRIAYIIWLPLLGFSTSGFYHLLQAAYGENNSGLKFAQVIPISEYTFNYQLNDFEKQNFSLLNQVSLVLSPDKQLLYRVSLPQEKAKWGKVKQDNSNDEHAHHIKPAQITKTAQYKGIPKERGAYYFDVESGQISSLNDKSLAKKTALHYLTEAESSISYIGMVTHFGPNYDFRNKRLPVWRVDFANANQDMLFVDPATISIVDHTTRNTRYERYSFSFLHKWNFFVPLMGRKNRDIIIVIVLVTALFATITGIIMLLKKSAKKTQ